MENEHVPESELENDSSKIASFGSVLIKQRESLNMTQADAASKLNLDVSYIIAIEEEDFSSISSKSYIFGYIRSYSKLLKLPEQEILDMYKHGDDDVHRLLPDYMEQKSIYSSTTTQGRAWGLMFVVVIGLMAATWWFISQ